jgi:hypothetical protein
MDPLHECGHQLFPDESRGAILFAFAPKVQDTNAIINVVANAGFSLFHRQVFISKAYQ